ncbi:MAG: glycosyltransferase family 2 protein [Prevotella sp.]|nr:glycosyltransferase family 2 protein [Prevotella sp.]
MKISIIIPVYNVSQYIIRCIDSVCAQTYPPFECLLIDDCGTDNSIEKAEQYIKEYKGPILFKIISHIHNQGQGVARNTGVYVATGDYLLFMDSDDAITPDCIETLVALAEKHPDTDFVQGNTIKGTGCLVTHRFHRQVPEYCNSRDELEKLILFDTVTTVWNRLIRRSFLVNNSLYFPEGIANCEDLYWIYFLSQRTSSAAFTNRGTYFYYINANSSTTSRSSSYIEKRVEWHLLTAQAIYDDMVKSEKPVGRNYCRYLANFLCNCMFQLSQSHSLKQWLVFWKMSRKIYNGVLKTSCGFFFYLSTMPPFCFLIIFNSWRWRLRHYIVKYI